MAKAVCFERILSNSAGKQFKCIRIAVSVKALSALIPEKHVIALLFAGAENKNQGGEQ